MTMNAPHHHQSLLPLSSLIPMPTPSKHQPLGSHQLTQASQPAVSANEDDDNGDGDGDEDIPKALLELLTESPGNRLFSELAQTGPVMRLEHRSTKSVTKVQAKLQFVDQLDDSEYLLLGKAVDMGASREDVIAVAEFLIPRAPRLLLENTLDSQEFQSFMEARKRSKLAMEERAERRRKGLLCTVGRRQRDEEKEVEGEEKASQPSKKKPNLVEQQQPDVEKPIVTRTTPKLTSVANSDLKSAFVVKRRPLRVNSVPLNGNLDEIIAARRALLDKTLGLVATPLILKESDDHDNKKNQPQSSMVEEARERVTEESMVESATNLAPTKTRPKLSLSLKRRR